MQESLTELQQRAEDCLRSLIFGLHPATHERLADPGVLVEPEVLRALMLALKALESKRDSPEQHPEAHSRAGQAWNKEEDRTLQDGFYRGLPICQITEQLARSSEGVYARLVRLGLAVSRDEAYRLLKGRSPHSPKRHTWVKSLMRKRG